MHLSSSLKPSGKHKSWNSQVSSSQLGALNVKVDPSKMFLDVVNKSILALSTSTGTTAPSACTGHFCSLSLTSTMTYFLFSSKFPMQDDLNLQSLQSSAGPKKTNS